MAKRKSILKRIEIEVAQRRRRCKHTGGSIVKGDICIVIYDGPRETSGYCRQVAVQMISDARQRLTEIENRLQIDRS